MITKTDSTEEIVDYIMKMLDATNGHWLPAIKDCNLSVSDKITCCFL